MRLLTLLVGLALTAASVAGCTSSTAPPSQAADGHLHAECTVCKYNADLACIDVAVDEKTPHCTHDGKTFYFCSAQCCQKFQKSPAKYEHD
jgi:YHS domain-containing protein